jgi:DNA repair exonuclease SbcCD ATPase subunit
MISTLSKDINDFKAILDKDSFWTEEQVRIKAIKEWNSSLQQAENKEKELSLKISSKNVDIEKIQNNIDNIDKLILSISSYNESFISWEATLNEIESDKQLYNQKDSLSKQIDHLQKLLKSLEIQDDLDDLQRFLKEKKIIIDTKTHIEQYQFVFDLWDTWNSISQDFKSLNTRQSMIDQLRREETLLQQKLESLKNSIQHKTKIQSFINIINERYEALLTIYESFGQFKKWIYENKVMPYLQNTTNNIINQISLSRPLYIKSVINNDSANVPLQFAWFMKDGENTIPISKASGFQKSMLSFAIRISLCQIGATSIKPIQLFIDEGFTACDHDNRSRVGDLLHNLLSHYKYRQLIIVTHLEDINAYAHQHIHITRSADSSNLQYGQPLQKTKIRKTRKTNGTKKN